MRTWLRNWLAGKPARTHRIPKGLRVYAVGDLHGRADLLARMLEMIAADLAAAPPAHAVTIFLGDYVDRGPDSRGVLELLCAALPSPAIFLLGNHETMLIDFLHDPPSLDAWRRDGGLETLHSYGVKAGAADPQAAAEAFAAALPDSHLKLLATAATHYECGDYFFCHAGVRPGVALEAQAAADLLWIREEFLTSGKDFGKMVVHGHTPRPEPEVKANRIGIDTGAYVSGRLTCLALEGAERRFLVATRVRG